MADKMLEANEKARELAREVYGLARRITAEIHAACRPLHAGSRGAEYF